MKPCYQATYHGVVVSRYRGVVVSELECFEDYIEDAVFAVLSVIFYEKVHTDTGYLVFARAYSLPLVGKDDFSDGLLFFQRKPMGSCLFPETLHGCPNMFYGGVMVSWYRGCLVSWYHGITNLF
jgi:hypothetical protein